MAAPTEAETAQIEQIRQWHKACRETTCETAWLLLHYVDIGRSANGVEPGDGR